MSNNTQNDQEYTFSKLLAQYDKILVPMIQRDYAQGRTDKKATDVRNNLLNDIFRDKKVHFDLVFGSKEKRIIDGKEMNCFIPVDGQQRLTTLFLLYLYGQKAGRINTELDLFKFSYDTRRAASDFCKSITSEEWAVPNDKNVSDVIKDSSWFMNYWEKDPTVGGMLNMLDAIHGKCKEITVYPNLDNVTFFLFDLESNGLNENLYLKMNSRGKPLTAFENLKAKIEKVLPDTNKVETKWFPENNDAPKNSFKEKWKFFMDRDWTEAFWDSETPEKYDESITKFIVRFLSGYWAAYGEDNEKNTADELKFFNSNENYNDFVAFEPIKAVLELDDAFPSLAYALTTVPQITPYWSNDTIKVSDKSEYKFLAVIFTYVLFDGDESAMRFAWNMAENYVTGYDTFVTYCKRAKEIGNKFNYAENKAFYKALSDNIFSAPSEQTEEEIAKAKKIVENPEWEQKIIEAEKYAFFKGAIRFLFTDGAGNFNWKDFDEKFGNAKKYFDENGVKNSNERKYKTDAILLKALISRCKDFWNCTWWKYKIFNNEASTWKDILLSEKWRNAVCDILSGNIDIVENVNDDENIAKSINDWCNDKGLLNYISKNRSCAWIRSVSHGYFSFWESGYPAYMIPTIPILLKLKRNGTIDYRDECIIPDSEYATCTEKTESGIDFSYKHRNFRWYMYPSDKIADIYLLDDKWNWLKKDTVEKTTEDDHEKYCCFDVKDEMNDDIKKFTKALDNLICSNP